jgi:sphingomyelin phosphodiesterase acid-like 3
MWILSKSPSSRFRFLLFSVVLDLFIAGTWVPAASAQATAGPVSPQAHSSKPSAAGDGAIPALLVSDIHFDPFNDPAKVHELVSAPVTQWTSILSAPPSSDREKAFAALQRSCHARGVDTPFALFSSSLQAMHSRQPDAKFMTVSGDLIAHDFSCRYTAVEPRSTPGEYEAFVLKTLDFVIAELRASFPGMPVYVALGNNDTGCGDYQLDAGGDFLAQAGRIVAEGLPASQRQQVIKEFGEGGYFSVAMTAPMHDTRLIVLNDVFQSPKYSTCGGKPDTSAANAEMIWLQKQLADARRLGQKAWVMGHIPPGIDPYSTVLKLRNVCGGQPPVEFLSTDEMADLLIEYADVVRLGIFAHTHMDEIRLLRPGSGEPLPADERSVAIKMVPSISPVDGNTPSFTLARVNPSTAILQDYAVIAASNHTGIAATWTPEYDYGQTYHEPEFSASTLRELVQEFTADPSSKTQVSAAYIRNFFVGNRSLELSPFWPEYVCVLGNYTAKEFARCVCSTAK